MKNILLLTTGGTIACVKTNSGLVPKLDGNRLLKMIPNIKSICNVSVKEILNIDSSNMSVEDWKLIGESIYEGLKEFDGIVVTHGTDTMSYTASIISYMLKNIDKPVVFTGSQIPITSEGSDATANLYHAFMVASSEISGVSIVFDKKIIRGTRALKIHSVRKDAFVSCNDVYLGKIDKDRVIINKDLFGHIEISGDISLCSKICEEVFLLKLIPGIKPSIVDYIVDEGYKGIVVEAFGLGGIPSDYNNLLEKLKEITSDYKIPVVVVSQCVYDGTDLNVYEVGVEAEKAGLLSGKDMSTEAAVTKLMWILGQTNDYEEIKKIMKENICGEITMENNKVS